MKVIKYLLNYGDSALIACDTVGRKVSAGRILGLPIRYTPFSTMLPTTIRGPQELR